MYRAPFEFIARVRTGPRRLREEERWADVTHKHTCSAEIVPRSYTSSVIRELAWHRSSCAVLRSTPAARRFVAREWRKLRHPIALPLIPARTTAGRMIFLSKVSGDNGCFPLRRVDGKMKSSSPRYGESSRYILKHFTTEGCNGTGLRFASVFVSPK
jgi:hypothetical protein